MSALPLVVFDVNEMLLDLTTMNNVAGQSIARQWRIHVA